jgi:hypothetical protein
MLTTGKPPLLLHAPGVALIAEGVDAMSREVAAARMLGSSTGKLRRLVTDEAARLGAVIFIDLFATADNTIVPRLASLHAEPLTEWVDALSMPSWAQSRCPH